MPIPLDWSERIRRLIENWEDKPGVTPLAHRANFERFTLTDSVADWDGLQRWLTELEEGDWVFRGQADVAWRLETSLERATLTKLRRLTDGTEPIRVRLNQQLSERSLLFEFQRRAHHYMAHTPEHEATVDWLALMQHFGAPTRLLDWTRSPYVALYFALEKAVEVVSCAVWAIDAGWLNEQAEEIIRRLDSDYPTSDDLWARYGYINRVLMRDANPRAILSASPIRLNERMASQQGLFLCNLNGVDYFDVTLLSMIVHSMPHSPVVRKLIIPVVSRTGFLKQLTRMNITSASLFPDLDGFARSLGVKLEIDLESSRRMAEEMLSELVKIQGPSDS